MVGLRWTKAFSHTALPYGTRRKETAVKPGRRRCGGFPAHEKCPAPTRGGGHFRVRLSGWYNALYLAAPWGLQGVRPGTPRDPVLRLRRRWKRALTGPQACAPLPPFLPPFTGGRGCTPPGRQKRSCGRTADEGRGLLQRRKQRLRFLADAVIHGMLFVVSTCKSVWALPSGIQKKVC